MSPVRSASQPTPSQRRRWLWMWPVSGILYFIISLFSLLVCCLFVCSCHLAISDLLVFAMSLLFGQEQVRSVITLQFKYSFCSIDVKEVTISGNLRVKEGETLNLTCSLESFPPSVVTWMKFSDNALNGTEIHLQNNTVNNLLEESGISTYSVNNVTAKDSGQYICTAKHLNKTLKKTVDVNVICKYTSNAVCYCCCVFILLHNGLQPFMDFRIVRLHTQPCCIYFHTFNYLIQVSIHNYC